MAKLLVEAIYKRRDPPCSVGYIKGVNPATARGSELVGVHVDKPEDAQVLRQYCQVCEACSGSNHLKRVSLIYCDIESQVERCQPLPGKSRKCVEEQLNGI